jgi:ABC-type uncharacterized transport system involved in gliding motility auxiliary subunit
MNDKRKMKISVLPYIGILIAFTCFIAAGLIYLNFPSNVNVAVYTLGLGIIFIISSMILRPAVLKEVFFSRKTVLWVNDIFLVLTIVGIGVVLSYIGYRRNFRYDFTYNQMFSLSEQTIKVARELEKSVKVTAFYPQGIAEGTAVEDLLKEYKRHSDRFSYTIVDPVRDPLTTRAMNIKEVGQIVVQCDTNRVDISVSDLFYSPNPYNRNPNDKPKFTGEQALTSAIVNVTSGVKRVISFVSGHGEGSITGFQGRDLGLLNEFLVSENFEVTETNLSDIIDSKVSVLVIANPQQDYLESEIKKIKEFLDQKDKNLLMALDYGYSLPNLENFALDNYAVLFNSDLTVDNRGLQIGQPGVVAPELADHAITKPLKEKKLTNLMYLARTISAEEKTGTRASVLVTSDDRSWGKRNAANNGQIQVADLKNFREGVDVRGPVTLGVAVERNYAVASGSKAVFFSDSDFFSNSLIKQLANRDLIINSINWAAGQTEMVSVRPRILEIPQIDFKPESSNIVFTVCVFGAPLFVVLFGGIVYMVRRRV